MNLPYAAISTKCLLSILSCYKERREQESDNHQRSGDREVNLAVAAAFLPLCLPSEPGGCSDAPEPGLVSTDTQHHQGAVRETSTNQYSTKVTTQAQMKIPL